MNEESVGKNINTSQTKTSSAGACPTTRAYEILFIEDREVAKSPSLCNGQQSCDSAGSGGCLPS
jgi:hypothetical protein